MRSWDLKRANRDHCVQRLSTACCCVKPDANVVLLVIAGEQPSGCEIRAAFPRNRSAASISSGVGKNAALAKRPLNHGPPNGGASTGGIAIAHDNVDRG